MTRHSTWLVLLSLLVTVFIGAGCTQQSGSQGAGGVGTVQASGDQVSYITNDSGRWLQVDLYDANGSAFKTMNLRFGDRLSLSPEAKTVKIRVNGKSLAIPKPGVEIRITKSENLEVAGSP